MRAVTIEEGFFMRFLRFFNQKPLNVEREQLMCAVRRFEKARRSHTEMIRKMSGAIEVLNATSASQSTMNPAIARCFLEE
jgi:hypothetical protein